MLGGAISQTFHRVRQRLMELVAQALDAAESSKGDKPKAKPKG